MALQPIGLDATITHVPDFTGGIDKMNRAVDSFAQNSKQQGGAFSSGFGEIVTGALRHVGTLAVDALLKAGQAVAGFVKASIGLAGTFEANMLQFQSVAGKDVDVSGLEEFRDLFLDIGKRLPVSTGEVQQAAIEMVKGGIDPATIAAGGLEQNIQFAAAAMGGDLVKAAEISSKILGGWAGVGATAAEKSDFLTHATDLLARAANASATDVEGLSRGIFNAQGIARTAGVSFDDLTTTLALLAPRFASSSEAGNSLKNVIARLQPTTANATASMIDLGLMTEEGKNRFFDATGSFIGFQAASELLRTSVEGLTDKQKSLQLQMIFGNDAMGSAAALAELGAAGYQEMADALANANGVAAAAELKQQGFNTALDNAKGSVEALQITIGSKLLPILTELMNNVVAPAVNTLTDLASAVFGDDDAFNKLSPTMQSVAIGIGDFVANVERGIVIAQAIGTEIERLIGSFKAASGSSDGLGSAIEKLNGVFTLALGVITNVANGYMAIANSVLPIIQRLWAAHGDEISAFVKTTFDSVIQIITMALQVYNAIVPPILNAIAGFFKEHGSEVEKVLTGAGQVIGAIVTGTMETIKGVFKVALALIHGDWGAAMDGIKGIVSAQATAIGGIVEGFLNIIAGLFDTSLGEIAQTWENNWNSMVDLISDIGWWEAGKLVVEGIQEGIDQAWNSLLSWFNDKVAGLVDAAMEAIGAASPATKFMPVGEFAVTGIMAGFTSTWPQLIDLVGSISEDLIGEMEDIGSRMQNAIADGFGATASIDRQIAKNLDRFKDVLPQYEQYTSGALKEAQLQAQEFLDPTEGAKFFKMRSDQILEYAKLQTDLSEATSQEDKDRINAQMLLINRAQQAEISQFDATRSATNPMMDMASQINEIMKTIAGIDLTDEQIHIVDMLSGIWAGLQSPPPQAPRTPYNPGATTTNTTNLSMPIYTNQSPSVLRDSMAVAGAALL